MAIPPNISFATAVDFGVATSGSVTLDVHDAGTNYDAFYKFTAAANSRAYWAHTYGSTTIGSGYQPHVEIYDSAEVLLLASSNEKPIQFVTTPGNVYYMKVEKNGNASPAVFILNFVAHVSRPLRVPGLLVPDDTVGFPATVLAAGTSNQVLSFATSVPHGEAGDVLSADGATVFLVEDADAGDLKVFDAKAFTLLSTLAFTGEPRIRANRGTGQFYVGSNTNPPVVKTVSPAGAFVSTYTLTGMTSLKALAASNDGTILYHADSASNAAIRRWNLSGAAALSDLASGHGVNYFVIDILVLDDDTIVASFINIVGLNNRVIAKRFDPDGTLLHTYDFGRSGDHEFPNSTAPRLAYDTEPGIFWFWSHHADANGEGLSRFRKVYA